MDELMAFYVYRVISGSQEVEIQYLIILAWVQDNSDILNKGLSTISAEASLSNNNSELCSI